MITRYEWSDCKRNGESSGGFKASMSSQQHRGQGGLSALFEHIERLARQMPEVCGLRLYVEEQ